MFKLRKTPCAVTKSEWEKDKSYFKTCLSQNNAYHCIQDEKNRSGEICIQPIWVQARKCPVFKTGAWAALDTVPCYVATGCPNGSFLSNEVYKYPVCLNKTHTKEILENGEHSFPWLWIVVPVIMVIAMLAVAAVYFARRLKRESLKEEEDETNISLLRREEDSEPFHKTTAFHEAIEYLKNGGKFLVFSGIWGSGKTKTAKEVYRSVTGKSPTIITDLEKFNSEEENQSLIFDEAISEDLSDREKRRLQEQIKTWLEKVSTSETKAFIIFTSVKNRKSTFAGITSAASDEDLKVINLKDRLTKNDRTQILYCNFTISCPKKDFSKIKDLATKCKHESLGYPEICALLCRCDEFQEMKWMEFCKTPLRSLKMYLEEMYHSKPNKFLMLVYMSLSQMEVDIKNPNGRLFNELETCKSNTPKQAEPLVGTITEIVRQGRVEDIHSLMSWEFVDKVPNTSKYRLQHDVIQRMTLIVFGTFHFDKLLELSKPEDLDGWIKEKDIGTKLKNVVGDIMPLLLIDGKEWLQYEQKMGQKTEDYWSFPNEKI